MTRSNGTPALAAVRELEDALSARGDTRDLVAAALDAARAEADRRIADARAEGTEAGRRRRAALLADAEADAMRIHAAGEADAAEILRHGRDERAEIVAEFTAVVLGQEA